MICTGIAHAALAEMNWGSSARNSSNTFGLSPLTQAPLSAQWRQPATASASSVVATGGWRSSPMPSHSRYSAPNTVSTCSATGARTNIAPTPAATSPIASRWPDNNPATAGTTARPRRPAAIRCAQSAPGVSTKRIETAQKAAMTLGCMGPGAVLPRFTCQTGEYSRASGMCFQILAPYGAAGGNSCAWTSLTSGFLPSCRRTAASP